MKIVSERLRFLREGVKLSQMNLAKMIGTTQSSINRYETDMTSPPYETLLWYADYFDVSLDYIFGRTEKPQGTLYKFQPKIAEDSAEMRRFIDMCFDPNSPMNERLKETLVMMLGETKN